MMAAIAAAIAQFGRGVRLQAALDEIGEYRSGRKSRGATHRSRHTAAQEKRAARKRRNKQRNKR